jgi:hypothetical protein
VCEPFFEPSWANKNNDKCPAGRLGLGNDDSDGVPGVWCPPRSRDKKELGFLSTKTSSATSLLGA